MTDGVRYGIFGASGCGKTYLALSILKKMKNVIIIDPKDDICLAGYTSVQTFKGFLNSVKRYAEKREFLRIIIKGADVAAVGCAALDFAFRKTRGSVCFFVDECQEICPAGTARSDKFNPLLLCARMGRSKGISLILASQRITAIDVNLRGNLNEMYLFRQGDFSDAQAVKRMIGVDLFNLPPREFYIKKENGDVKHYKRAQDVK